jgi:hypothetical protein
MRLQKNKPVETHGLVQKVIRKAKTRKVATRTTEMSRRGKSAQQGHGETNPVPKEGQRQPSYKKEGDPSSFTFIPCSFMGPDGKTRPGWEMRVGDMVFGRADSQETLMAYYTRLHNPLPSGHWRERTWGPQKRKPTKGQSPADHEEGEEHADHEETDFDLDTVIADDGKE